MSDSVQRTYTVLFKGRPSIRMIRNELENAAKAMADYNRVAIEHNGSSDLELEEITFTIESD